MQFDFAGDLAVADGRYLARDNGGEKNESVLVVETLAAAPLPGRRRRRRRPRPADPHAPPAAVPLARVTAVRAAHPFEAEEEAERWLHEAAEAEDTVDVLVEEGLSLLNRALHAQATASANHRLHELAPESALTVRLGYGSGKQVAAGAGAGVLEVDVHTAASKRRQRAEELRPQERLAAVLGGRERIDPCETLLLRARADLAAGRNREAALQLRVGLEALLAELDGALSDADHVRDMATLKQRRGEAGEAANEAIGGELAPDREDQVRELLEICERILRRRRVIRGG